MSRVRILIPGLGKGSESKYYQLIMRKWRHRGFTPLLFDGRWQSSETAMAKYERLAELVHQYRHDRIELIGFSAGCPLILASGVIHETSVKSVRLISGKLQSPETIGAYFKSRSPQLQTVVRDSHYVVRHLDSAVSNKLITYIPLYDGLIPKRDMRIPGVCVRTIYSFGHRTSIVIALLCM